MATDVPLGMEATDMGLVNAVQKRNDALERVSATRSKRRSASYSYTSAAATDVTPMPEDETYAARYFRAFKKKR